MRFGIDLVHLEQNCVFVRVVLHHVVVHLDGDAAERGKGADSATQWHIVTGYHLPFFASLVNITDIFRFQFVLIFNLRADANATVSQWVQWDAGSGYLLPMPSQPGLVGSSAEGGRLPRSLVWHRATLEHYTQNIGVNQAWRSESGGDSYLVH